MKQLRLGWFGATGAEKWSSPTCRIYDWQRPELLMDIARLAERAKLDYILFADTLMVPSTYGGSIEKAVQFGTPVLFDPVPVIAMMGAVTKHIGLGSTLSTVFTPPFTMARQLATLDHLTGGRAMWNVVTAAHHESAANYGQEMIEHDTRYDMADEYLDVCRQLWDSWEPDALLQDRASRRFADESKVRRIDYEGKYYKSKGPLNVHRSPQGHPLIVMAGTSPRGQRYAAENAEMTIVHSTNIDQMKKVSADLRSRLSDAGRDPYACLMSCSIKPIIGDSRRHAEELREMQLAQASVEEGMFILSSNLNTDLSKLDLDEPLPTDLPANIIGSLNKYTSGPNPPTLREVALAEAQHETFPICGTAEDVAEVLEETAREADVDGFHFRLETQNYEYLLRVATRLIPVLQDRGLFRTEYTGKTLRENLFGPPG